MEHIERARLAARLKDTPFAVETVPLCPSTNEELLARARAGDRTPTLLAAQSQSAGRGRLGKSFYSPADCGVYFSLLLPGWTADAARLTALTALAVCEAAEELGARDCRIKWVNDVYCRGKKACGILAQSVFTENAARATVLGIGANLTEPKDGWPAELRGIAGSFFTAPKAHLREDFIAAAVRHVLKLSAQNARTLLDDYRARSFLFGRRVEVLHPQERFAAVVLGIDEDFRLIVKDDAGRERALFSGEVSLKL